VVTISLPATGADTAQRVRGSASAASSWSSCAPTAAIDAGGVPAAAACASSTRLAAMCSATRSSRALEIYSLMSLATAQDSYNAVIDKFPI